MKHIQLNANTSAPILGFGTWQLTGEHCVEMVKEALKAGYRHIDTADRYSNHQEVAEGIKQSGVLRTDFFLTSKIHRTDIQANTIAPTIDRFLKELHTDYLDLLLIHWPNKDIPIAESLGAMDELRQLGKLKAIGVSNFTKAHIEEALSTGITIDNNQIEIHPSFNQIELVSWLQDKGISATAYSPLGRGEDLQLPVIQEIAEKRSMTPAQVIISWLLSRDIITIPKADTVEHIEGNLKAADLKLEPEDIESINAIPQQPRIVSPEWAEWGEE